MYFDNKYKKIIMKYKNKLKYNTVTTFQKKISNEFVYRVDKIYITKNSSCFLTIYNNVPQKQLNLYNEWLFKYQLIVNNHNTRNWKFFFVSLFLFLLLLFVSIYNFMSINTLFLMDYLISEIFFKDNSLINLFIKRLWELMK